MAIPAVPLAMATGSFSNCVVYELRNLIFILTAECNSQCSYCYQTAKKALGMGWPTLEASVDLSFQSTLERINIIFSGGEPLLEWKKIKKAVEYADRNGPPGKKIRYRISTNGLLVTDEIADFLAEHKFGVQLSCDGIAEAQNYRRQGSFAVIDGLLERLRKRQPRLFEKGMWVSATVMPATIGHLADSIRYLTDKGVCNISISPSYTPSPDWALEDIQRLDDQFSKIYDDSLRYYEETGKVPLRLFRKMDIVQRPPAAERCMCNLIRGKTLAVDVDGQAYGCALLAESYQQFSSEFLRSRLAPLRMGDIRNPDFWERHAALPEAARRAEIFDHKERKHSSYGNCAECPYLDQCFVCPMSIGYLPGNTDPHRVPDFICAFNKVAGKYRERFPYKPNPIEELEAIFGIED